MLEVMSLEAFKDVTGNSYSRLSKLAEGPQAYRASLAEDVKSSAVALGSAVDLLLTDPDNFQNEIYVMTTDKPNSEMMRTFCEVYAETNDQGIARESSGFKIGIDAIVKKFDKEGVDYYNALIEAGSKKIIDAEQMFRANQIVHNLRTSDFTKQYFTKSDNREILFQVPVTWKQVIPSLSNPNVGIECVFKGIIDMVEVRHDINTITPIDLKTGEESFRKSYFKYKRYLQGAMYYMGLIHMYGLHTDYSIMNTKFIYADTKLIYPPVIYRMNDSDIEGGINGVPYFMSSNLIDKDLFLYKDKTYKHKGYVQLAAELHWHEVNDIWDYSYDVYQNNGEIEIDAFNIKL